MKTRPLCRLSAVVVVGLVLCLGAGSARAGVPVMVGPNSDFTFPADNLRLRLRGQVRVPLGVNFEGAMARIEVLTLGDTSGEISAFFPGLGGQTTMVNDGDSILHAWNFQDIPLQISITDMDPVNDFGGGLGDEIVLTTNANLVGTGEGTANTLLPNLGFLNEISILGLSLGTADGTLAELALGVDLDNDTENETLTLTNLFLDVIVGQNQTAPGFTYEVLPAPDNFFYSSSFELRNNAPTYNGAGSVNPDFQLALEIDEWTLTKDILIQAVPEPASASLLAMGSCLLLWFRSRKNPAHDLEVKP